MERSPGREGAGAVSGAVTPGRLLSRSASTSATRKATSKRYRKVRTWGSGAATPWPLPLSGRVRSSSTWGPEPGFDCFLAAERVGPTGHVIGVDMTPDMLDRARENAKKGGRTNVEFRLGEIEHLPVADNSVDVVISNCVINLSPDKPQVFREAFRVLRPGGRLMVSDIVLAAPLPAALAGSALLYNSCVAGALVREEYLGGIAATGFTEVTVQGEAVFPLEHIVSEPDLVRALEGAALSESERASLRESILSIKVAARKPGGCTCGGTC